MARDDNFLSSIRFTVYPDPYDFITPAEIKERTKYVIHTDGGKAIEKLLKRFEDVLKPGGTMDVGVTGKASKNVKARWNDAGGGAWEIYEGDNTPANRLIRTGIPPDKRSLYKYEDLRKWAGMRNMKLYHPDDANKTRVILDKLKSTKGLEYERSRWFGRVGIKPETSFKPSQVARSALYAIRTALIKHGTQRPTANWWNKRPSGQGRFDYPVFVLTRNRVWWEKTLVAISYEIADAQIYIEGSGKRGRQIDAVMKASQLKLS